jgi:hypothetical protein
MLPPMNDREAVKVLIINDDGQYLTGTAIEWDFTEDRSKATVFDYHGDRVAERIELVRKAQGQTWIAVRLDPREIYEFCDQCGCRKLVFKMLFDGRQFLCGDCRDDGANA